MDDNQEVKIDLSYLDEVSGGNAEFIVEMIEIFLQQTPNYIATLQQAFELKDWKKIAEASHKIKPTLAFMGLHKEQEEMALIEMQARAEKDFDGIKTSFDRLSKLFDSVYQSLEVKKKELQGNI